MHSADKELLCLQGQEATSSRLIETRFHHIVRVSVAALRSALLSFLGHFYDRIALITLAS